MFDCSFGHRKNNEESNNPRYYESMLSVINALNRYIENSYGSIDRFRKVISELSTSLQAYKQIVSSIPEVSKNLSEAAKRVAESLKQLVDASQVPSIAEKTREQLKQSCEKWGQFGWTMIPAAPVKFYYKCPDTISEANKAALYYCKSKDMKNLFNDLKAAPGVKTSDLDSAIFCFNNRQYKACSMLLFSMIDAKLIRGQRKEDFIQRKGQLPRRASGSAAAKIIDKHIKEEQAFDNQFVFALHGINLFECLSVVFCDGKDFREQPNVINRNFIDHGMLHRPVKRMNCVQLFLLYYNLIRLFDNIR